MPAPNIFNFFKPHKGQPLARKGMAEFLAASGKAWATLDVLGGELSWDHGRPMIIVPGSGGGGGGAVLAHGWRASVVYDTENEEGAATVTVRAGFRIAIGGNTTREPQDQTITVTSEELASGVWIIKQYSGTLNAWIEGIQKTTEKPEDEAFVNTIDVKIDCDTESADVDHEVWPDTFRRQRRVVCYLDSDGLKQCAVGAIYVVGNPDMEVADEDVDEDDADDADDVDDVDRDCDQNNHPGDDDYGDDDDHPGDPTLHPGDDPIDQDDDDHPGSGDCYTTR